jgi:hypothetical protein
VTQAKFAEFVDDGADLKLHVSSSEVRARRQSTGDEAPVS